MKIYLNKYNALLLKIVDVDIDDFDIGLAGAVVSLDRKLEVVKELRDACDEFINKLTPIKGEE